MIRPDLRSGGALASKLRACSTTRGGAGRGRVPSGGVGEAAVTSHGGSHLTPRQSPHTATSHGGGHLTPRQRRSPHTASVTSHRHLTPQRSPHTAEVTSHCSSHLTWQRSPHTAEITAPNAPRLHPAPPPAPALLWWRSGKEKQERSGHWKKPAPTSPEAMPQLELPHKSLTSGRENPQLFTLTELTLTFCQVFNLAQNNLSQVSIVLSWQILKCYSN